MKKILVLLFVIALFGCEKESFNCTVICTVPSESGFVKAYYYDLTEAEAEEIVEFNKCVSCRVECE